MQCKCVDNICLLLDCCISAVERVLQNAPHLCKNKAIKVERYLPGANNEPEMEDEETPLRTVEISGVPLTVSEELIENYLENKRRGGGPFEDYNFKREEGTIIVTFVDAAGSCQELFSYFCN